MANFQVVGAVVEVVLLISAALGCLTVMILMIMVKGQWGGLCPYYGHVTIDSRDPPHFTYIMQVNGVCNYIIGMSGILAVMATVSCIYRIVTLWKKKQFISFTYTPYVLVFTYGVKCVLTLVAACYATVGFNNMCSEFRKGIKPLDWDCKYFETPGVWSNLNPTNFYEYMTIQKFASWAVFIIYLLLVLTSILYISCYKRMQNRDEVLVKNMETGDNSLPTKGAPTVQ